MAIQVTRVVQIRDFTYSTDEPNGALVFHIYFEGDFVADNSDYDARAQKALIAVDPNTGMTIPQMGDRFGTFDTFASNITVAIHEGQNNWWIVTVDYTAPENSEEETVLDEPPDEIAPTVSWGTINLKKKIYQDNTPVADGGPLPIANSIGEGLTTLPVIDEAVLTLRVTRRTLTYDPLIVLQKINHVNDAAMTLMGEGPFDQGSIKLVSWTGNARTATVQEAGESEVTTDYFDTTRVYHIKADWLGRVLDQGLLHTVVDAAYARLPMQVFGQNTKSPQPLDGTGQAIYDEKGILDNMPVTRAIGGPVGAGVPGIEPVIVVPGPPVVRALALLLFTYYAETDLDIGDT